jgi:membrane protein required for colicin V production
MLSYLDILLIILLGLSLIDGLRRGLWRMLGQIVGLFLAVYIASQRYLDFYNWAQDWLNINETTEKIISFLILFFIVSALVGLVFFLVEKVFKFVSIIPLGGLLNRLLGAALALFGSSILLGLLLFLFSRYSWAAGLAGIQLTNSVLTPPLVKLATGVLPYLPDALKTLQSITGI